MVMQQGYAARPAARAGAKKYNCGNEQRFFLLFVFPLNIFYWE